MHFGLNRTLNKKVLKVGKTKPPFLIQKNHQFIFAALLAAKWTSPDHSDWNNIGWGFSQKLPDTCFNVWKDKSKYSSESDLAYLQKIYKLRFVSNSRWFCIKAGKVWVCHDSLRFRFFFLATPSLGARFKQHVANTKLFQTSKRFQVYSETSSHQTKN